MNTFKIIALFSFLLLGFQQEAVAQRKKMDKETKKQLKSFMKNPASYRRKERAVNEKLDSAAFRVAVLEERYDEMKTLNRLYYDSISALNARLRDMERMDNNIRNTIEGTLELEYRVQIGAYAMNNFDGKAGLGKAIKTEVVNGVTKYYIGSFKDPWEAEDLATAIRTMGISGAFIVKFIDGKRVNFDIRDLM